MQPSDLQAYNDWDKRKNSWWTNFAKTLKPAHFIVFFGILIVGIYVMTTNKNSNYYILGGVGLVILFMLFRKENIAERIPVPENVLCILGTYLLKKKIGVEYPWGTHIVPSPYDKLRYQGAWGIVFNPWKWEKGFIVYKPDGNKIVVKVIFHAYDGYITGVVKSPSGYTGEESFDLKILQTDVVFKNDDKK